MEIRKCKKCGKTKDLNSENFRLSKCSSGNMYFRHICKTCIAENTRNWRKNNSRKIKEIDRRNNIKSRYKITIVEFEKMLEIQDGRCAICKEKFDFNLIIDHNHKTGKIRGLLCHNCNRGLGMFKDSTHKLQNAVNYLGQC